VVSVDTNVLVRFLTRDDRAQAARAEALFGSEGMFIATTVLLETEWVLRSVFEFEDGPVMESLGKLAGLPNVHVEDPDRLARALKWRADGIDFADALHIAAAGNDFRTFDERLAKRARRAGIGSVRMV